MLAPVICPFSAEKIRDGQKPDVMPVRASIVSSNTRLAQKPDFRSPDSIRGKGSEKKKKKVVMKPSELNRRYSSPKKKDSDETERFEEAIFIA